MRRRAALHRPACRVGLKLTGIELGPVLEVLHDIDRPVEVHACRLKIGADLSGASAGARRTPFQCLAQVVVGLAPVPALGSAQAHPLWQPVKTSECGLRGIDAARHVTLVEQGEAQIDIGEELGGSDLHVAGIFCNRS